MIIKQNVLLSSRERNDNINLIETQSNKIYTPFLEKLLVSCCFVKTLS